MIKTHTYFSMSKITLTLILLLSGFAAALAQPEAATSAGTATGHLVDENGKDLEYVMVSVLRAADSMTVGNSISNTEGQFRIEGLPLGELMLKVECMGYRTHYSPPFTLTPEDPAKNFNKFQLKQKSTRLSTVEVSAKKEMIQSNLDKQVFNVESSIVAEGATAVEILEEIPSVDVDLDGNVTLRGSENVTVLIDGRPSNLTLDQIPAEQIESVEVITNPSARLEPDGMAGILNVILKKKRESGFNGLVSLGGAMTFLKTKPYFDRYNGNVNLNYNYNKINVFLNYNFRHFGHHSYGSLDREAWFGSDTSKLAQENHSDGGGYGHNVRTGIDWFIDKKNSLNLTLGYNFHKHSSAAQLQSSNMRRTLGEYIPFSDYEELTDNGDKNHNISASMNYKRTFEVKGMELTTDLYYTQMWRNGWNKEEQNFIIPDSTEPFYQNTQTIGNNRNASAQVDFITPVGNGGRIETGYKISYRFIGQDYSLFTGHAEESLVEDISQSNNFDYSELINAAYFIYSNSFWDKLKIQLGLRAELANTKSDLKSLNSTHYKNYFNLFPTVHIRYDFNLSHSMQISYSRRVSRPRVWQLNPFIDYSDRQNWSTGNPDLHPEFVNSVELGYLMNINKSSLNTSVFYRQRKDIITRYTELLNDSTTLTTYKNLNSSHNLGLEITYGQRLWKFWKITLSGSVYYEVIESNNLIEKSLSNHWNWNIRLNQNFTLPKDWDLQLNFRYNSPGLTVGGMGWGNNGVGQGKRSARYSLNFGVKKSMFNKNFVISMNFRNIIYNRNNKVHTYSFGETNGYDAYSVRVRSGLEINLTLSYKFNNYKRRKEMPSGEDEMFEEEY